MIYFLMIIFFFVAFCLIGLILLQEGKGGGLAAGGSGAMDAVMGARNPLRRWTVYFAVALLFLILGINYHISRLSPAAVPEGLKPPAVEATQESPPGERGVTIENADQGDGKEPAADEGTAQAPASDRKEDAEITAAPAKKEEATTAPLPAPDSPAKEEKP